MELNLIFIPLWVSAGGYGVYVCVHCTLINSIYMQIVELNKKKQALLHKIQKEWEKQNKTWFIRRSYVVNVYIFIAE